MTPAYDVIDSGRRTLLRAVATMGIAVTAGSVPTQARLQDEGDADIRLEGRTTGWVGIEPAAIDGDRNPTLELEVGETHVLVWENGDGVGHNFVIEDADGEIVLETEIMSGTGETQTVEFTAEEGMAEYFCAPHPQSMRGEIELVDAADEGDGADAEDESAMEFAAVVDDLYTFTLEDDGWFQQESLAETDGEDDPNPTLELEAGGVYVIRWTNELEGDESGTEDESETDDSVAELVLETDDGEEYLRADALEVGETGAVTFTAPAELATYRDETTGAQGDLDISTNGDS